MKNSFKVVLCHALNLALVFCVFMMAIGLGKDVTKFDYRISLLILISPIIGTIAFRAKIVLRIQNPWLEEHDWPLLDV
jgi:ABC-type uncharacterized transport system involved in gliding motility auxiliary subunit